MKRVKRLYSALLRVVLPELSVVKVRTGLLQLFSIDTSAKMRRCFSAKPVQLETQYWLIEECHDEIVEHCRKIHFKE